MNISDQDKINHTYKMMNIIGKNGCSVLPEGLFNGFDDWMIQKVVNRIINDYREEISKYNKEHKINKIKIRNNEIVNEICCSDGKLTVDDYLKEICNVKNRIIKICNKIVEKIGIDEFKERIEHGEWTGLGSYEDDTIKRLNINIVNPFIYHSNGLELSLEGFGNIIVSGHAVDRLRIRNTNLFSATDSKIIKWLKNDLKYTKKARIKSKYIALQLLNHKFEKTTYRMNREGMVYVFVGNTIKTVHGNEAERYCVM